MNSLFPLLIAFCAVPFFLLSVVALGAWVVSWFVKPKTADEKDYLPKADWPRWYKTIRLGWIPAALGLTVLCMVLAFSTLYPLGASLANTYVPVAEPAVAQPVVSDEGLAPVQQPEAQPEISAPVNNDWDVVGFENAVCPRPDGMVDVISPENDFRTMVRMGDGRLYQPCLPEEAVRPVFDLSFTGYCVGEPETCKMTVHTINSALWWDSDKDGDPDQMLASHVGSKVVTIHNGGWYKIVAGEHNGGLDLVPLR